MSETGQLPTTPPGVPPWVIPVATVVSMVVSPIASSVAVGWQLAKTVQEHGIAIQQIKDNMATLKTDIGTQITANSSATREDIRELRTIVIERSSK